MLCKLLTMDNLKLAASLKKEAEHMLQHTGIERFFSRQAEIYYTGSYALDLMVYRDIDIYLASSNESMGLEVIMNIYQDLIRLPDVFSAKVTKFMHLRYQVPKGIYLGVRVQVADGIDFWKLDIWAISKEQIVEFQDRILKIKDRLTRQKKEIILRVKKKMCELYGKPPMGSSYYIYQAVVFNGLQKEEEILNFILEKGVKLP